MPGHCGIMGGGGSWSSRTQGEQCSASGLLGDGLPGPLHWELSGQTSQQEEEARSVVLVFPFILPPPPDLCFCPAHSHNSEH